ncbi:MAG: hypothetical protein GY805_23950 [Chloroflexi bacterium]|nr:hypothetical protein [Chloroflexota bacterium]
MKLGEALINRADAQKRVPQIRERLSRSAKVQKGEKPPEKPETLLQELDRTLNTVKTLIQRINKTNLLTTLSTGQTISDALAERDAIAQKRTILSEFIITAASIQPRFTRSEIKFYSTVEIKKMQKQVDNLAKQYRELDSLIQAANWATELIEE